MDRRRIRGGGLHKNLLGTQSSSQLSSASSTTSSQLKLSSLHSEQSFERKRKSQCLESEDSIEDLGLPLAESTVIKKKRKDAEVLSLSQNSRKEIDVSRNETQKQKLQSEHRSFTKTSGKSEHLMGKRNTEEKASSTLKQKEKTPKKQTRENNAKRLTQSEGYLKLLEFFTVAGISNAEDGSHILQKDVILIQKEMGQLLRSGEYNKNDIIKQLEKYLENEDNLNSALDNMETAPGIKVFNTINTLSLIRILLQVSELYPEIYSSLLYKLNESVLAVSSMDKIPWAHDLLKQFRFLDIVINKDVLIENIEQLLETCPEWFTKILILYLPDIVTDKQHQTIAEILMKVWRENSDLTKEILDCISSLNLPKDYLEECWEKALQFLKTAIKTNIIPTVVHFITEQCTNIEVFKNMLTVLRGLDIQPLPNENPEDCFKHQVNIINTLKLRMVLSKDMINATIAVVKDISKDPKPLDLILLLLVFSTSDPKKKVVEALLKQHIKTGFYRASLLALIYKDYKLVIQELQPTALRLSSKLLQTTERVFIDFAINWFRLQFQSYENAVLKQRPILEQIIIVMCSSERNAKNALTLLCEIAKDKEKQYLMSHCNQLRVLIDKVKDFDLEEVGMLYDLLYSLCMNSSSTSDALREDLHILLQKQLSIFKPVIKCKGVLAAVMAIKHLMTKQGSISEARDLFHMVQNNVKACPRSQTLFYDQLSNIIAQTKDINLEFIKHVKDQIEDEFIDKYMIDKEENSGDCTPKFGLNNEEDEPQEKCILKFDDNEYGAIIPISFKLLKECCVQLSNEKDLEPITALLGCSVLISMPDDFDIPETSALNSVIYCINWFREIINGFVDQSDPLLRKQVLQRVNNLIYLQKSFSSLVGLCNNEYQPPPCYFHTLSVPPFVEVEKKFPKKGKGNKKEKRDKKDSLNDSSSDESQLWKKGSVLCSKNPMYFRKFEPKIVRLLEKGTENRSSSSSSCTASMQQICFIVYELINLFNTDPDESLIKELVASLPTICAVLQDIVDDIRQDKDSSENKEAVKLLLSLLIKIFNWKGFESVTYNALLREALRTLARQVNDANSKLRSCRELVAESYKYFEPLLDIATQISLAVALINLFKSLMKHSETYMAQNKDSHAKAAFSFLSLEWVEDQSSSTQYKAAVTELLNNWIDFEPQPLQAITRVLEWLPEEVVHLVKSQDPLKRLPSVKKNNFHIFYKKIFDGLLKGVRIALAANKTDPERIKTWQDVAQNIQKLMKISKGLKMKNNVVIFLKYMPLLLRIFLRSGMPVLEHNLKYQVEDVTAIVKLIQGGTRYLHAICCDTSEKKDVTLSKYVPAAKSVLEQMIYSVKGMLVLNNSPDAFWMGNLVNKNLEGQEILSQNASEQSSIPSEVPTDEVSNLSSEILESDSNDSSDSVDEAKDA